LFHLQAAAAGCDLRPGQLLSSRCMCAGHAGQMHTDSATPHVQSLVRLWHCGANGGLCCATVAAAQRQREAPLPITTILWAAGGAALAMLSAAATAHAVTHKTTHEPLQLASSITSTTPTPQSCPVSSSLVCMLQLDATPTIQVCKA
jgi:hypothetical protein